MHGADEGLDVGIGQSPFFSQARITSYNVCYTKLLREHDDGWHRVTKGVVHLLCLGQPVEEIAPP